VYELSTVKAAVPDTYRFTLEEWRAYQMGYYFAVARSLKVMDLALNRWKMARRTAAAATRARKRG